MLSQHSRSRIYNPQPSTLIRFLCVVSAHLEVPDMHAASDTCEGLWRMALAVLASSQTPVGPKLEEPQTNQGGWLRWCGLLQPRTRQNSKAFSKHQCGLGQVWGSCETDPEACRLRRAQHTDAGHPGFGDLGFLDLVQRLEVRSTPLAFEGFCACPSAVPRTSLRALNSQVAIHPALEPQNPSNHDTPGSRRCPAKSVRLQSARGTPAPQSPTSLEPLTGKNPTN